jgi:hypothetical protein
MQAIVLGLALASVLSCYACGHTNAETKALTTNVSQRGGYAPESSPTPNTSAALAGSRQKSASDPANASAKVDFPTQIRPILEARCQPCHFNGGKVYARMPFDRPETIKTLGTKLFTRLKDESERRLIRDFLAQE